MLLIYSKRVVWHLNTILVAFFLVIPTANSSFDDIKVQLLTNAELLAKYVAFSIHKHREHHYSLQLLRKRNADLRFIIDTHLKALKMRLNAVDDGLNEVFSAAKNAYHFVNENGHMLNDLRNRVQTIKKNVCR